MEEKTGDITSKSYDNDVLEALIEDPTRSARDIAEEIGTYRQRVWREKTRLERGNAIWGYTAVIDEIELGQVLYIVLTKTKPMTVGLVDRLIDNIGDGEAYGVRLINFLYLNGEYDWLLMYSAPSRKAAKRFYEYVRTEYQDYYIEKPIIIEAIKPLIREGKLLPNPKSLEEYAPI